MKQFIEFMYKYLLCVETNKTSFQREGLVIYFVLTQYKFQCHIMKIIYYPYPRIVSLCFYLSFKLFQFSVIQNKVL